MSVVDLVARCTTGSCQKSNRFSKVVRLSTENLTSCVFLKRKKWRVQYDFGNVFLSIPNPTRCKSFKSKSDLYWNFQFKILPFKKAVKMQNMSFSRSKKNQNVIFWMQTFFQNLTRPNFFNSKSSTFNFFQSKTICFVKLLNQNLTRFEFFFHNLTR